MSSFITSLIQMGKNTIVCMMYYFKDGVREDKRGKFLVFKNQGLYKIEALV